MKYTTFDTTHINSLPFILAVIKERQPALLSIQEGRVCASIMTVPREEFINKKCIA